jgi:hypothetical protein
MTSCRADQAQVRTVLGRTVRYPMTRLLISGSRSLAGEKRCIRGFNQMSWRKEIAGTDVEWRVMGRMGICSGVLQEQWGLWIRAKDRRTGACYRFDRAPKRGQVWWNLRQNATTARAHSPVFCQHQALNGDHFPFASSGERQCRHPSKPHSRG